MSRTKVKNSVLGPEFFGTVTALTAGATVNVNLTASSTFTITPSDNTTTFNIQNAEVGMVKNIVLTGDGTERTLAFQAEGGTGATFNKIGATTMDSTASAKSIIQLLCVDATSGAQQFWYSISKPQAT